MKIFNNCTKHLYFLTCILLTFSLFGCDEKGGVVTVLDGVSDSPYLTQMKTSLENKKPVAVSFTAEWCPHCRAYKPVFFEVKDLFADKVTFINIDVDDQNGSAISGRFQVRGIPTTAFIRPDGSVFKVQVGEIEKEELTKIANDLIKSKKKKRGEPIAPFPIESKKEEPKKEEPTKEEPKIEEPKIEEPKIEEPTKEEPKIEEPVKEEPVIEDPSEDE